MPRAFAVALALAVVLVTPAMGQQRPIAFVGAHVIPVAGAEIPDGTIIVHQGRIVAVGPRSSVTIPTDAERRDVTGMVLMPAALVVIRTRMSGMWQEPTGRRPSRVMCAPSTRSMSVQLRSRRRGRAASRQ